MCLFGCLPVPSENLAPRYKENDRTAAFPDPRMMAARGDDHFLT
jgi:hypothetical protein